MLVIFTDGAQTQKTQDPRDEDHIKPGKNAQKLKDKNVTVIAVGAGTPDPVELMSMATDPKYVIVTELEDLGQAVNKITERICRIEVTVRKLYELINIDNQ